MANLKNFKIQLNDSTNLRDLLQGIYQLADEQIVQVQNEINKMANATQLQEESIEGKSKYGKIINDYLGIKDKAIAKKITEDTLDYTNNKEAMNELQSL